MKSSVSKIMGLTLAAVLPATFVPAQVKAPAEASAGPSIYVPKPKETSLDEDAEPKGERLDVVHTLLGDRMSGRVLGISPDGVLSFRGPQLAGEASFLVKALDRVSLRRGRGNADKLDELVLTNDDRLAGKVVQITSEQVLLESAAAGQLSVPRRVIEAVVFAGGTGKMLVSEFDAGRMAPFKPVRGEWRVEDGKLVCNAGGQHTTIAADVDQSGPVTLVVDAAGTGGHHLNCDLMVYADELESNYYGRNSVFFMFQGSYYNLQYAHNGGTRSVGNNHFGRNYQSGQLRMAFDPESQTATLWINDQKLGEHKINHELNDGRKIAFNSRYPVRVSRIELLPGIVPPSEDQARSDGEEQGHTIHFRNKDVLTVTDVTMADGRLVGAAGYGELNFTPQQVDRIVFATKDRQRPRRQNGDVLVTTSDGRITLQLRELSDTKLRGNCEHLGDVAIDRQAIERMEFNIYRDDDEGQSAAAPAPPGNQVRAVRWRRQVEAVQPAIIHGEGAVQLRFE